MHTVTQPGARSVGGAYERPAEVVEASAADPLAVAAAQMDDDDVQVLMTALETHALTRSGRGADRAWRLYCLALAGSMRGLVKGVFVVAIDDYPPPTGAGH